MCGGTGEDRCEAEAMDETTVNALDTVRQCFVAAFSVATLSKLDILTTGVNLAAWTL